tara:strand:- start:947 stop:1822 length:876 start_codon:yes stop_codon:yes gene_type:complete
MKYVIVRLSDSKDATKFLDLKFKLLDNGFVKKWIDCVLEAQQNQYPISEPWAIYNLNNKMNGEFVKDNLNRLMQEVDAVEKLFNVQLTDINDQSALNKIHAVFELNHGKLDEWKSNPLFLNKPDSFRKNLSEINQFVHACEDLNKTPKIRIVYFDLPKTKKFTDADYELFTNKRSFGSIYHLYSDVGKPIEDLSTDNDADHHDIVPNLHYSADCVVYFHNDSDEQVRKLEEKYAEYIEQNKEYIETKGYDINSKKLTTGKIELARLETTMTENEVLTQIKNFDNIQSLSLI